MFAVDSLRFLMNICKTGIFTVDCCNSKPKFWQKALWLHYMCNYPSALHCVTVSLIKLALNQIIFSQCYVPCVISDILTLKIKSADVKAMLPLLKHDSCHSECFAIFQNNYLLRNMTGNEFSFFYLKWMN